MSVNNINVLAKIELTSYLENEINNKDIEISTLNKEIDNISLKKKRRR